MKKAAIVAGCLLLVAGLAAGVYFFRHRYVRSDEQLLQILPAGDVTTFYANVEALRDLGMLRLLTGTRVAHDPEYERFVRQVNFDYTRDLDRLVAAYDGKQLFVLLEGRFDWTRLRLYPQDHGGQCVKHDCTVPSVTPGRWASYHLIQPDVLAVAFSSDSTAVRVLQPPAAPRPVQMSGQPVWMRLAESVLQNPAELPAPLPMVAIALQAADPVVLSAGPAAEGSGAAFVLQLDAACPSQTSADTMLKQLEIQNKMLQLELRREGRQASAGDLTGLLMAGSFRQADKHVLGVWPVRQELLGSLQ